MLTHNFLLSNWAKPLQEKPVTAFELISHRLPTRGPIDIK
jgi:hypothetical protein